MSLIWMDGFDNYNDRGDVRALERYFVAQGNTDEPGYSPTAGRFGGGALTEGNAPERDEGWGVDFLQSLTTCRIAFSWFATNIGNDVYNVNFSDGSSAVGIRLESNEIVFNNLPEGTVNTGKFIETNTWHWVEIELVHGASGSFTYYIDGEQVYTTTGDFSTGTGFTSLKLVIDAGLKYDDLILWNNDGSGLSSFPLGESKIETLRPNSLGDINEFTPQGDSSNELTVDDTQGNDGDTTYNSGLAGQKDLYGLEPLSTSNIQTVHAIKSINIARKEGVGFRSIKNELKSGTTNYSSSSFTLETAYKRYANTLETNPDTGSQWKESEVNNIQIGATFDNNG